MRAEHNEHYRLFWWGQNLVYSALDLAQNDDKEGKHLKLISEAKRSFRKCIRSIRQFLASDFLDALDNKYFFPSYSCGRYIYVINERVRTSFKATKQSQKGGLMKIAVIGAGSTYTPGLIARWTMDTKRDRIPVTEFCFVWYQQWETGHRR